ncbi:MAG TPA: xanthine dehydrogenase family protein subunit M [Blastocatellia bacterium]|nr:xanthine dehydrogenase family protein subunit M [Blastocatellia bacterium]
MIPSAFEYFAPSSVSEAVSLLSTYRDQAKLLAGGHSLIPLMKLRLAQPKYVIDLSRIAELTSIRDEGDAIVVGALARHHAVETSDIIRQKCPVLAEAAGKIGDVQVRNMGTIGGSLAHADPAADYPAAILALGAQMHLVGPRGERSVMAEDFFVDLLTTALQPDELLVSVRIPAIKPRTGTAYIKIPQKASGFALCGVAALVTVDQNNICQDAAIGITGVAAKAYRAKGVEASLRGQKMEGQTLADAAAKAAEGVDPLEDIHASAEYRAHLARVCCRRALELALSRI